MRDIRHFIDGAAFDGASGRFSDVFNPKTGDVQARVQLATTGEVDRAVQAAVHVGQGLLQGDGLAFVLGMWSKRHG